MRPPAGGDFFLLPPPGINRIIPLANGVSRRCRGGEAETMAQTDAKSGSTKKILFLVVVIIAVALAVAGYFVKDRKAEKKIITSGDRAPDFRLTSLEGRSISLAELRGKIVMVHFWATWCPPCVEELPTLAKLSEELKGGEFEMLAVSVDEGGGATVDAFLRKNGLALPVFLDPGGSVSRRYGTYKFPETYILDREGIVRHKVIGPADWRDPAALQLLRNMIASR
jgi:peroxiredoxin